MEELLLSAIKCAWD